MDARRRAQTRELAEGRDPVDAHWAASTRGALAGFLMPGEPLMPDLRAHESAETIKRGLDQAYKASALAVVEFDGGPLHESKLGVEVEKILERLGERLTVVVESIEKARRTHKRLMAALDAETYDGMRR